MIEVLIHISRFFSKPEKPKKLFQNQAPELKMSPACPIDLKPSQQPWNRKIEPKTHYKKILKYYKIKIPRSKKETRKKAIKIMGTKLCRCIEKVKKRRQKFTRKNKNPETAVCTSSIFTKRGLKHGRFTCKKKYKK